MPLHTSLHDWHRAHGGHFVPFAGWDMPIHYGNITDEHRAVRTAAGLFDVGHMGRLLLDGPGALDLIQQVYTNDAATMKSGQVRYGLVCNEQGGIRDDVLVYRLGDVWLMVVNASNRDKILAWLDEHRASRDVSVADCTLSTGMVAVQGPQAVAVARQALDALGWRPLDAAAPPVEGLRYYFAERLLGPDAALTLVSRTGYTGEDGVEVIASATAVRDDLVPALFDAAGRLGVPLRPCGLGARDTLRLEAGMPLYGHELTEETDPLQAGLGWAVKMDKGDFVGRDALLRRRDDPTRTVRVGLELEGRRAAREGCAVLHDGRPVGRVTSGTFAPTLQKAVAMAYVEPAGAAPATVLGVDVRGKPEPARVVPLPFYRRASRPAR